MSCTKELSDFLKTRGFRMTPQRHAIMHILKASGSHLSPAEVYEKARLAVPGITETTVYRTLDFLAENDVVQPTLDGNRHLVYEIAGHEHHHLVCRSCGYEIHVDPEAFQKAVANLEKQTGYRITAGHFTFFGFCPKCKKDKEEVKQ